MADVAADAYPFAVGFDRDQFGGELVAEDTRDTVSDSRAGGKVIDDPAVVAENEMNVGVRNRQARDRFGDMPEFGDRPFEEFAPDRRVEKEVPNFDGRAAAHPAGNRLRLGGTPFDAEFGAVGRFVGTAFNDELAHFGD